MFSKKDKSQIKAFLKGEMEGKQLATFKQRLQREPALLKKVFLKKMVQAAAKNLPALQQSSKGLAHARKMAMSLEDDLFDDAEKERLWQIRQQNEAQTYTLAELLAMFEPIEEYEESLTMRTQSTTKGITIIQPENGLDLDHALFFELETALPFALKCTIQDSQEEEVIEQILASNQTQFTISLPNLPPGRYYWILKPQTTDRAIRKQYNTVIGMFMVKGWLNPHR